MFCNGSFDFCAKYSLSWPSHYAKKMRTVRAMNLVRVRARDLNSEAQLVEFCIFWGVPGPPIILLVLKSDIFDIIWECPIDSEFPENEGTTTWRGLTF